MLSWLDGAGVHDLLTTDADAGISRSQRRRLLRRALTASSGSDGAAGSAPADLTGGLLLQ